ncbi:ATP-binding protein [Streptomyces phyllanthi]|uniref:ATP-binding protein n=1 Tax=Streptomyces phyllanthi TaxID=1803180 RepID=UPI002AD1D7F3|nr:ATP-binding protein [Streptomyces phyllanthi]
MPTTSRVYLPRDSAGFLSRSAELVDDVRLGLADRLLGRAQEVISVPETGHGELRALVEQLAGGPRDALLIAESRSARLSQGEGSAATVHDALAHGPASPEALGLRSFPGGDLVSARAARHYVRDTARSWGLPRGAVEDIETVTGELMANALEHSDSETISVTLTCTAGAVVVSVTDQGQDRGRLPGSERVSGPVSEPIRPQPQSGPQSDQEDGRGLLITDALSARWGTRWTGKGLTVWAEVVADLREPVR